MQTRTSKEAERGVVAGGTRGAPGVLVAFQARTTVTHDVGHHWGAMRGALVLRQTAAAIGAAVGLDISSCLVHVCSQ
jgi:hypothetical protein